MFRSTIDCVTPSKSIYHSLGYRVSEKKKRIVILKQFEGRKVAIFEGKKKDKTRSGGEGLDHLAFSFSFFVFAVIIHGWIGFDKVVVIPMLIASDEVKVAELLSHCIDISLQGLFLNKKRRGKKERKKELREGK